MVSGARMRAKGRDLHPRHRWIEIVGASEGMDAIRALGAAFQTDYPGETVLVPPSIGSAGGIAAVSANKAALARISRALDSTEVANGLISCDLFRLPIAIYVHRELALQGVSYEQLIGIYEGRIKNWREIGGPELNVSPVRQEARDPSHAVMCRTIPGWRSVDFTTRCRVAATARDAGETVKLLRGGVGFGPYPSVLRTGVRILEVEGLTPTDNAYPSFLTVALAWREDELPDLAQNFISFTQTEQGKTVLRAHGVVPIKTSGFVDAVEQGTAGDRIRTAGLML